MTALAIEVGIVQFLLGVAGAVALLAALFGLLWFGETLTRTLRAKREAKRKRLRELRDRDYSAYLAEVDEFLPQKESRFKTKVRAFFRGLGDFLILLGNVVRVKKWKICPLVEIPEQGVDTSRPVV
jgi:hypothetical protein